MKKKENLPAQSGIRGYLSDFKAMVLFLYFVGMLGVFPLVYKNQYESIGNLKYEYFWNLSLILIGGMVIYGIADLLLQKLKQQESTWEKGFSLPDKLVAAYGIFVLISYGLSSYKAEALKGAAGWDMGLCSQLIFVATYFIISRVRLNISRILTVHMTASGLAGVFGILHRFQIDPLGMYEGLNLDQKTEFLSTIGQATWYSSYICTGFGIGLTLFYVRKDIFPMEKSEKNRWLQILTGIYSVIGFATIVTQNSDSAFMALLGILLLLGFVSLKSRKSWVNFLEVLVLMSTTFLGIGLLQKVFAERMVPLGGISIFFSQSIVIWIVCGLSVGAWFFCRSLPQEREAAVMKLTKMVYCAALVLLVLGIIAMLLVIYLNTKGLLEEWFGWSSKNQYLLFNKNWGNNRGRIWGMTVHGLKQMSPVQLLFGVGPDALSPYLYSIEEISTYLQDWLGAQKLTNAHNEYLNSLLCYGIAGLAAWLGVLFGGIGYFIKKAEKNPYMIAFGLCIIAYVCHNIFCYQQVCCTPFLFIFMGVGESLTKFSNLFISVYKENNYINNRN